MLLIEPLTKDIFVYEKYPTVNTGASSTYKLYNNLPTGSDMILELGSDEDGYRKKILLEFDLDNVISRSLDYTNSTIQYVYLNLLSADIDDTTLVDLPYYLTSRSASFEEDTVTWNNA